MVSIYGAMTHERKTRIWELWRKGIPMSLIACDIANPLDLALVLLLFLLHRYIPQLAAVLVATTRFQWSLRTPTRRF
ncbi:hypothetical protein CUZ56_01217 [Saezia sanguinis]|uniref:Uncharacterized protein n=1 Tax=Saezia sanguinis TaxID=1965230 RepID=A0A433SF67_9BURK|nr:hypothetical protein CUZ56_01217 [Saezia sanguinis]